MESSSNVSSRSFSLFGGSSSNSEQKKSPSLQIQKNKTPSLQVNKAPAKKLARKKSPSIKVPSGVPKLVSNFVKRSVN